MADFLAQYEEIKRQYAQDFIVLQDDVEIKVNAGARRFTERLLLEAKAGLLGAEECFRLHDIYYRMARRMLLKAEAAADPKRSASLTYWGNRHKEIADGLFESLDAQRDFGAEREGK